MLSEEISNLIDISSIAKSGLDLNQNHANALSQSVSGLNQRLHELAITHISHQPCLGQADGKYRVIQRRIR